jgi:hypothetical protein
MKKLIRWQLSQELEVLRYKEKQEHQVLIDLRIAYRDLKQFEKEGLDEQDLHSVVKVGRMQRARVEALQAQIRKFEKILEQEPKKQTLWKSMTLIGWFSNVLPEESVGELLALHQQLVSKQLPSCLAQLIMFRALLEIVWVFQIQMKIENLWLPQTGKTKGIDE